MDPCAGAPVGRASGSGTPSKMPHVMSFHKMKNVAALKYGKATERPQDVNKSHRKAALRTNLEIPNPFPDGYEAALNNSISCFTPPKEKPLFSKFGDKLRWIDNESLLIRSLDSKLIWDNDVLAVDFEFSADAFDGFIVVASISSPFATMVIDCLYENYDAAKKHLKILMETPEPLKVFCGASQDIIRMQKDWSCSVKGFVDLQNMFVQWKDRDFQDCVLCTKKAVDQAFKEKGKEPPTFGRREDFLLLLNNPSLDFLINTFIGPSNSHKNKIITLADWRARPINKELLNYTALDSFNALVIFYELFDKIGKQGLKEAMTKGITKLTNTGKLPKYKVCIPPEVATEDTVSRILKWRLYLAQNLDKEPDNILPTKLVQKLAHCVLEVGWQAEDQLQDLMEQFQVGDDKSKAARLLGAYLNPDGKKLNSMKFIDCNNCNTKGHTSRFCPFPGTPESKRAALSRPEYRETEQNNARRREINWAKKRGLDPNTAVFPWKKKDSME